MANKYGRIKNSQSFNTKLKSELIKAFRAHYTPTIIKADVVQTVGLTLLQLTFDPYSYYTVDGVVIGTGTAGITLAGTGATAIGFPAIQLLTTAVRVQGSVITGANPATLTLTASGGSATLAKGSFLVKNEVE